MQPKTKLVQNDTKAKRTKDEGRIEEGTSQRRSERRRTDRELCPCCESNQEGTKKHMKNIAKERERQRERDRVWKK